MPMKKSHCIRDINSAPNHLCITFKIWGTIYVITGKNILKTIRKEKGRKMTEKILTGEIIFGLIISPEFKACKLHKVS